MHASMSTSKPTDRVRVEARCLGLALIPMSDDDAATWFRKLITAALFLVWSTLTLEITAAEPSQWLMYALTATLFLIIGRLWDIKIEEIDVTSIIGGSDKGNDDDR